MTFVRMPQWADATHHGAIRVILSDIEAILTEYNTQRTEWGGSMASLEHFYYGQLVHHGQPTGDPRVLAKSGGVTDEFVAAALRSAMVPPLPVGHGVSWAILREEREVYCIMTQAQTGVAGQVTRHFAQIPLDTMRALGGHLQQLFSFVEMEVPVFEMLGDRLPPIVIENPGPPPTADAVDSLLDLMTFTGNNTRNIEPLLSAVVRNIPLIIQNAPRPIDDRVKFIQGLLMLLPSSTRFNTTFATHVNTLVDLRARIQFYEGTPPENTVIFDWSTGVISGAESKDEYSRFILSQLRLDAELVIQETDRLTPTAGWRFRMGVPLADALAYASHRSSVDRAVMTGQPVEVAEVSRILAEDPTLSDDLRASYVRHIVNFSLALNDMQNTDAVAVAIHHSSALGDDVHRMLTSALQDGRGALVADTIRRWLDNPLSPQGPQWMQLMHQAHLADLDQRIAAKDYDDVYEWLQDFQKQEGGTGTDRVARSVIERIMPLAGEDERLPSQISLIAMSYLDKKDAQRILALPALLRVLPKEMKVFLNALNSTEPVAPNMLSDAAAQVGEAGQDKAALLFSEMAYNAGKHEVFDTPTLERLARIAPTPFGRRYRDTLLSIARTAHDTLMDRLPPPGPRAVLQLMLAGERYDMLSRGMMNMARDVYGVERQGDYVRMIQEVFAQTPLTPEQVTPVLTAIELTGLAGIPLMAAQSGVLEGAQWSPALRPQAEALLDETLNHPDYWELTPPEVTYNLVRYFYEIGDDEKLKQAGYVAATNAAIQPMDVPGLQTISQSYKLMRLDKPRQKYAFEIIRQYVRLAKEKPAQRVLSFYSKELGNEAAGRLNIAYNMSGFMGRIAFDVYIDVLHQTAEILQLLAESYMKKADKPTLKRLQTTLDTFRIKMDERGRKILSEDLKRIGLTLVGLSKQHDVRGGLFVKQTDALVKGTQAPRSSLDVWKAIGGHIARGRTLPVKLTPGTAASPWGELALTPTTLAQYVAATANVLESALKTPPIKWTPSQIATELDSLQGQLPAGDKTRERLRRAAVDFQRIPDLIKLLVDEGDINALEPESRLGKRLDMQQQEPRNALESLRFYAGTLERLQ